MATVVNSDVVDFPLDAYVSAPIYQGRQQLSVLRLMTPIPNWGGGTGSDITLGQLWPRGNRINSV